MLRITALAILLASPAAAQERRVVDYLQDGWEIKAAMEGPPRMVVLQKGGAAVWCEMRDAPTPPVTLKGVPQLFTASCEAVR
jgi:hypothetical protein